MSEREERRRGSMGATGLAGLGLIGLLVLFGVGCTDDEGADADPARAVQRQRIERFRASFPERAAKVCAKRGTDESPFAARCRRASEAMHEALAELLASHPPDWEPRILALGGICQREANAYSQAEVEGRSEADLYTEGLERAPACIAEQYEHLRRRAEAAGAWPPA